MLRVTLHINAEQIGDYEVRNVDPGETSTDWSVYEVRDIRDGHRAPEPLFTLRHKRVDGANALAAKVLLKLSRWGEYR